MYKGNPHRDHPLKFVGLCVLVALGIAAIIALYLGVYWHWEPVSEPFAHAYRAYPVLTSGAMFGAALLYFAYRARYSPKYFRGGNVLRLVVLVVCAGLVFVLTLAGVRT